MQVSANLLRQVVVRRREPGYLRCDLPPGLGAGTAAAELRQRLEAVPGVYRVRLDPTCDKLAVRFQPAVCDAHAVARALAAGLRALEAAGLTPGCERCVREARAQSQASGWRARALSLRPVRWARERIEALRRAATALQQVSASRFKHVPGVLKDPERAVHEFLTDILVLYLIRVHWERITQQWMRAPFTYRNEWLAVAYLVYLMVRARRQGR
jgi:hypothetical protein